MLIFAQDVYCAWKSHRITIILSGRKINMIFFFLELLDKVEEMSSKN